MRDDRRGPRYQSDKTDRKDLIVAGCQKLNLRARPVKDSAVISVLTEGTRLHKIGEVDNWYRVRTTVGSIKEGFVMRAFVVEE